MPPVPASAEVVAVIAVEIVFAITNGADVVSVSARLGHSDSAVTLRMYAHANEESKRRAGDIFRNAIGAE